MKKIISISHWFKPHYGGVETHLSNLGDFLTRKGLKYLSLSTYFKSTINTKFNYEVKRFGSNVSSEKTKEAFVDMLSYLKKNKDNIKIVYLALMTSNGLPINEQFRIIDYLQRQKIPLIVRVTSHKRITALFSKNSNIKYLEIFRNIDCFVALSNEIKQELMNFGIKPKNIFRINNCINTEVFKINLAKKSARFKINIPDKITFLYYGRFDKKKNIYLLLRSWENFCKKYQTEAGKFQLLILGDKNFEKHNIEEIRKFRKITNSFTVKNVIYKKSVRYERIPEILSAADFYVNLSEVEGMSNSLLEAMATGLICLVPDTSLNRSILISKETLFVNTIDSISDMFGYFYENLKKSRLRIAKRNRDIILKKHKDIIIFGKYLDKIKSLTK